MHIKSIQEMHLIAMFEYITLCDWNSYIINNVHPIGLYESERARENYAVPRTLENHLKNQRS
jgi:hypothetical protein